MPEAYALSVLLVSFGITTLFFNQVYVTDVGGLVTEKVTVSPRQIVWVFEGEIDGAAASTLLIEARKSKRARTDFMYFTGN